jgi:putative drug exporter of the RND superfamily
VILPAWLAAAVAAQLYLPTVDDAPATSLGALLPSHSKSLETERRAVELFRLPLLSQVAVVQRDPHGLSDEAQKRVVGRALRVTGGKDKVLHTVALALPITNERGIVPGSRERGTTAITYLFFRRGASLGAKDALGHTYGERYVDRPGDALVGVTGAVPARVQEYHEIRSALPYIELATVLLIALILGASFRSFGVPVVTLAAAGLAFLIADHVLGWTARGLGQTIPRDAKPVTVALMLGIVTDYSVFFFSGARARVEAGEDSREAARQTTVLYGPIVLTAGLVVAAGTASLLAGTLGFLRAFGPGMAITVLIGLAVSITFVPALLAIFGKALFWPALRPREEAIAELEEGPRRPRLARIVTSRAAGGLVALACIGALLVPASQIAHMKLGLRLIDSVPGNSEPARAAAAATRGFADGILGPVELVVEAPRIVLKRQALNRLQAELARQPGIAGVAGPRQQPLARDLRGFGAAFARNGNAARYVLVLRVDPESARGIDVVRRLDDALPGLLARAGLGEVRYGLAGEAPLARETVDSVIESIKRIALIALLVNLILLVLFLRALVAPLYLLAASALGLAASLGLTTWVFQDLLGHPDLAYFVPLAVGVLLVSLGSDYNLFVVGRIWQEAEARPLWEAIAFAVPRTSRAIGIAGAALAGSFGLLAIVELDEFRAFAFALGVGVLIDTFVVRAMLVPSLIALFGEVGWWPRRRRAAQLADEPRPA